MAEHGFYGYCNPMSGEGLGADYFSWAGSSLIESIAEKTTKD